MDFDAILIEPRREAMTRAGFTVACTIAAVGAAIAFAGLETGSFVVFTLGCTLIGVYMSAQGFYRFAAADVAPAACFASSASMSSKR